MKNNKKNIKCCLLAILFTSLLLCSCFLFFYGLFVLPKYIHWFFALLISEGALFFGGFSLCCLVYNVERIF